jgi:two-component sensor histidine kinase
MVTYLFDELETNRMNIERTPHQVEEMLGMPDLADALESKQFTHFLDKVPIAIVVASMNGSEHITYANPEFEKLSKQAFSEIKGKPWTVVRGQDEADNGELSTAIMEGSDHLGCFRLIDRGEPPEVVDAYSNVIESDDGTPVFRLVALVNTHPHAQSEREKLKDAIRDKDMLLLELQHRVKNNLQMITALIRLEARASPAGTDAAPLTRIAGRIDALHLLYQSLSADGQVQQIDLGAYLSQVASAVMRIHALDGVRLNVKVDSYPVSVNVAMPAGLVVNELMTNALKHAFAGRDGGTITLHCIVEDDRCRVIIADDGVGLPSGVEWPKKGNLGALIVQSLKDNARANIEVESSPERGTRVTLIFAHAAAA